MIFSFPFIYMVSLIYGLFAFEKNNSNYTVTTIFIQVVKCPILYPAAGELYRIMHKKSKRDLLYFNILFVSAQKHSIRDFCGSCTTYMLNQFV